MSVAYKIVPESGDQLADSLMEALLQTFPTVCYTRLRMLGWEAGKHRVLHSGDFSVVATVPDLDGVLLWSMSISREVYQKLVRNVFPKEVATDINPDTRDLLVSVLRRSLELGSRFLQGHASRPLWANPVLVEGSGHTIYVPSGVTIHGAECVSELGPISVQFARFPKDTLGVRV